MPVSRYLCIFINEKKKLDSALPVGVPVPWPSATPIRNIEGFADGGIGMSFDAIRGAFYDAGTRSARMPNNTTDIGKTDDLGFDASRVVPTANENRPRNIAFNYIVRAA
ncbi:hypothetical protein [Salmonella enterica]|uniref:hypothetical protein n=1 Tax=Salmonella enterica TaxID=28901 RepID=UPI00067ABE50|nr:hypothetical protein [Salmonella enterica]